MTMSCHSSRYFEFEVLTAGPMRVGWAKVEAKPGYELGQDDCSWAFDGWRVRDTVPCFGVSLIVFTSTSTPTSCRPWIDHGSNEMNDWLDLSFAEGGQ